MPSVHLNLRLVQIIKVLLCFLITKILTNPQIYWFFISLNHQITHSYILVSLSSAFQDIIAFSISEKEQWSIFADKNIIGFVSRLFNKRYIAWLFYVNVGSAVCLGVNIEALIDHVVGQLRLYALIGFRINDDNRERFEFGIKFDWILLNIEFEMFA